MPRSAPSGNESGSGEVPRFAPSVTSSEWMEGEALEDALDILTHDKLKEITWLGPPPHVGRGRDAALTTFVLLDHKAVLCNLLGVGASRVVYSLGTAHAIKYEYSDPLNCGSNRKEASIALEFPSILPWTLALNNGCLLVRQAPYT